MLMAVATFSSCKKTIFCINGSGSITSEQYTFGEFDEVEISIPADVYITQDESVTSPEMRIEGQRNVLDNVDAYVSGDKLKVKFQDCVTSFKDIVIYIKVKDLDYINLNGSGNIYSETTIESGVLEAVINGSGDIDLDVDAVNLKADIRGSGNIKLKGTATNFESDINGSGDIRAFNLNAANADVHINGSGKTEVRVSDKLDVNINGSGDVYYKGYPQMSVKISGSGKIVDAN